MPHHSPLSPLPSVEHPPANTLADTTTDSSGLPGNVENKGALTILALSPATEVKSKRRELQEGHAAKHKAALSSVFWSGLLAVLKVAAGLFSNSLGMLSEALHSTLDMVAASITFFAVRMADRPADKKHPFGHGKVEHLAALAETLLLFVTCGWIIWEAIDRLFFSEAVVEPSWWVFAVVIISLVVDVNRSAMLRRVAKEHRSQALEADALHFTTDIWSSAVVLVGLACVALTKLLEPGSLWHTVLGKADAVAALGVAGIVLGVSWNLAKKAVTALMDGGNEAEADRIRAALQEKAPAWQARRVRVRSSGAHYFVELTVAAPPSVRVGEAHDITVILESIVDSVLPGAESVIHVEPAAGQPPLDMHALAGHLAALRDLSVHGLALVSLHDGLHVFVHVELPPDMPLAEAHTKVSAYEEDLCRRLGARHVVSHIEPLHETPCSRPKAVPRQLVLDVLAQAMREHSLLYACHDEDVWRIDQRTGLSFHCHMRQEATVAQAHEQATELEADLLRRLPFLSHVIIHVEPCAPPA